MKPDAVLKDILGVGRGRIEDFVKEGVQIGHHKFGCHFNTNLSNITRGGKYLRFQSGGRGDGGGCAAKSTTGLGIFLAFFYYKCLD